jgi:hypothetical protein
MALNMTKELNIINKRLIWSWVSNNKDSAETTRRKKIFLGFFISLDKRAFSPNPERQIKKKETYTANPQVCRIVLTPGKYFTKKGNKKLSLPSPSNNVTAKVIKHGQANLNSELNKAIMARKRGIIPI